MQIVKFIKFMGKCFILRKGRSENKSHLKDRVYHDSGILYPLTIHRSQDFNNSQFTGLKDSQVTDVRAAKVKSVGISISHLES